MSRAAKLNGLRARPNRGGAQVALSEADGRAVIAAYRRGVASADIAEAIGVSRNNLYSIVGTWALKHCKCGDDK